MKTDSVQFIHMPLFTPETLETHLRGRGHIDWLSSRMGSEQATPVQDLYERRIIQAEMTAVEVYHGLIWFLEAYPQIKSVRPIWKPLVDEDGMILVKVRLALESDDPRDMEEARERASKAMSHADPLEKFYGYDDPPPSIEEMSSDAFDTLIELCEEVGPETWNEFNFYSAVTRKQGYGKPAEVEADMEKDCSEFVAELSQRLLELKIDMPTAPARPKPRI